MASSASLGEPSRRDLLHLETGAVGIAALGSAVWPSTDETNPDAATLAATEIDLGDIALGQSITVKWRGKPIFVRHRTAQEIAAARAVAPSELRDPASDASRVENPEWLVVVGICTHLGCVPLGRQAAYGGWFCACHGSAYDTSGRIRQGPAPHNLAVPPYSFTSATKITIG